MEKMKTEVALRREQAKNVFLPHCTWDKFGEILANSGGRSLGLFDELTAFLSTMNMYSSVKMQVSDTKEYQDFLQMYTGKTKTRETGMLNTMPHKTQSIKSQNCHFKYYDGATVNKTRFHVSVTQCPFTYVEKQVLLFHTLLLNTTEKKTMRYSR